MELWNELSKELIADYGLDHNYRVEKCGRELDELEPTVIEITDDVRKQYNDGYTIEGAVEKVMKEAVVKTIAPKGCCFARLTHPDLPAITVMTNRNVGPRN